MRYFKFLVLAAALAGCSDAGTGISTGGTFVMAVNGEQFRVRIDNALLASQARRMMTGQAEQKIVMGEVAKGDGGFNTGYSWHLKPETVSFADLTMELCDGRPSDIQANVDAWIAQVKVYCPWGGRFVGEVGRF